MTILRPQPPPAPQAAPRFARALDRSGEWQAACAGAKRLGRHREGRAAATLGNDNVNKLVGAALGALLLVLPSAAQAEDLTFKLTNASSYNVKSFFTSPTDVDKWEEDVFGDNYLPAGNEVDVTIADGREQCVYDMRFVFEDDSDYVEKAVDLCELGQYTLSDAQ
jgi:hypothetical protein